MPDLNTVPPSPHTLATSRRQSQQNPNAQEPPSPSLNILPSNQSAVNPTGTTTDGPSFPPVAPPQTMASEESIVGSGPGPLRHPRPLTASELHIQLEKEQEALVNRLTRELSILRTAHNASVASNTSSASQATSGTHEPQHESSLLSGAGFSIPTTRRHNRTSSSASQNYVTQLGTSHDSRPHVPRPPAPTSMSRQNSTTSRRSQTNSPAPPSSLDPSSYFQQQRVPAPLSVPVSGNVPLSSASTLDQASPGLMPATSRYEETAFYRNELETAKKENDTLKKRIRDLEKMVKERREAGRNRSESQSTTTSTTLPVTGTSNIAGPRDSPAPSRAGRDRRMTSQSVSSVAVGVPDDELQVGESAASSGRAKETEV